MVTFVEQFIILYNNELIVKLLVWFVVLILAIIIDHISSDYEGNSFSEKTIAWMNEDNRW